MGGSLKSPTMGRDFLINSTRGKKTRQPHDHVDRELRRAAGEGNFVAGSRPSSATWMPRAVGLHAIYPGCGTQAVKFRPRSMLPNETA